MKDELTLLSELITVFWWLFCLGLMVNVLRVVVLVVEFRHSRQLQRMIDLAHSYSDQMVDIRKVHEATMKRLAKDVRSDAADQRGVDRGTPIEITTVIGTSPPSREP